MSSSNTGTTPTPGSDAFLDSLLSMVNQEDMVAILKAQSQMLDRFEKTNEMLSNFNRLSAKRYEKTVEQFKEHTETLLMMKKDLDSVFRRIRALKKKLATDHPRAFVAALEDIVPPDLDEEDEEPQSALSHSNSNQPHQPSQPLLQPSQQISKPPSASSPRQQELHQQQQHHQQQKQHPQQPQPQQLHQASHLPHLQQRQQQKQQKQQLMDKVGMPGAKEQVSRHGSDDDK